MEGIISVTISPLEFFGHLRWIDERPLMDVIEPYRRRIFMDTLHTFGEGGTPHYNLALTGRGKKNWKSADLIWPGSIGSWPGNPRRATIAFCSRTTRGRPAMTSSSSRKSSP